MSAGPSEMERKTGEVAARAAERMGWLGAGALVEAAAIQEALAAKGVRKALLEIAVEQGTLSAARREEAERIAIVAGELAVEMAVAPPSSRPPERTEVAAAPAPAPALRFEDDERRARTIPLRGERVVLGRAPDCDAIFKSGKVSIRHAEIVRRDGRFHLRDLGSTNGTQVNGEAVKERALSPGDEILIFPYRFLFVGPSGEGARPLAAFPAPAPPADEAEPPVRAAAAGSESAPPAAAVPPGGPFLAPVAAETLPATEAPGPPTSFRGAPVLRLSFEGEGKVRRQIDVDRFPATIGSSEGCAVLLRHPGVTPVEAEIRRAPDGFSIAPSPGGIVRIGPELLKEEKSLFPGDRIQVGPYRLECRRTDAPAPAPRRFRLRSPPPAGGLPRVEDWRILVGIPAACLVLLLLTFLFVTIVKARHRRAETRPAPRTILHRPEGAPGAGRVAGLFPFRGAPLPGKL